MCPSAVLHPFSRPLLMGFDLRRLVSPSWVSGIPSLWLGGGFCPLAHYIIPVSVLGYRVSFRDTPLCLLLVLARKVGTRNLFWTCREICRSWRIKAGIWLRCGVSSFRRASFLCKASLRPPPGRATATNRRGRSGGVRLGVACRRTKAEWALVHNARCKAWSGSLTAASLVTALPGRSRSIDCALSVALSGGAPTQQ